MLIRPGGTGDLDPFFGAFWLRLVVQGLAIGFIGFGFRVRVGGSGFRGFRCLLVAFGSWSGRWVDGLVLSHKPLNPKVV